MPVLPKDTLVLFRSIEGNARIMNREIPTQDHGGCIYTLYYKKLQQTNLHGPACLIAIIFALYRSSQITLAAFENV